MSTSNDRPHTASDAGAAHRARWQRIEAILDDAFETPPEDLSSFLDQACGGDPDLRAEVAALLAADAASGDLLETPALEYAAGLIEDLRGEPSVLPAAVEGSRLGPYQVLRRAGGGGMGVVYEALDTRLDRRVALKLLPEGWSDQPEAKARFLQEARAASALDHANICTLHDLGETDDGRLYLVMAYYAGGTLKTRLENGPLPVDEARRLARQIARGLERAHEAGIVHRDVKPANVLVTEHGDAKLVDFGIAKIADATGLTRTGGSVGTPAYMSPEQMRGQPADERADVWGVGLILYEMLTGRHPFAGEHPAAVIQAVLNQEPESVETSRPGVPEDLRRVVARALAKDPGERYRGVDELLADLDSETSSATLPALAIAQSESPSRWTPSRWARRVALGAAAVVLAVLGSWWAARDRDDSGPGTLAETVSGTGPIDLGKSVSIRDIDAEEMATSSPQALRYFLEGQALQDNSKGEEAIPLFEKAVELDPEFAMALAALGNLYANHGRSSLAREVMNRAVENADRLSVRARDFVIGEHYSNTWATYDRAVAAFKRGVGLYPNDFGLRGNLAGLLVKLELYEEAIVEYRWMLDKGYAFAPTFFSLASAYAALDSFSTGYQILEEYNRRSPENWFGHFSLGWHLAHWQRFDEASESLTRAEQLRPGDVYVRQAWWRLNILREDWAAAARDARSMTEVTSDPFARWLGEVSAAWTALYSGHSEEALAHYAAAAAAYPEPEANTALARCWAARLYLQRGEPEKAYIEAVEARREAPEEWPELEGIFLSALAHQALGRSREADRLADELTSRSRSFPNAIEERQVNLLRGNLALARGKTEEALRELASAAERLPPRGVPFHDHILPDHVRVWFALGEAELAAGRPRRAAEYFQRVAESGVEHVERPVLWVRSFFRLADIYSRLGESTLAAAEASRAVDLWSSGDLNQESLAEAKLLLGR